MKAQLSSVKELVLFEVDDDLLYCKPIEGWPDYHASTCGRIVSTKNEENRGKPRVLNNYQTDARGYQRVVLCDSTTGRMQKSYVHRLVAQTHLAAPDDDPRGTPRNQVNHIDSNPRNNKLSNLEFTSRAENLQHAMLMRRHRQETDS